MTGQVELISTSVPWMTAVGNHEHGWSDSFIQSADSGGECSVPYLRRFPFARQPYSSFTPDPNTLEYDQQPWYSFDYGNVHFCVISTEHDWLDDGSPQRKWIEADLKAADANRATVPWVLFAGHRPMYVDSTFKGDQIIATYLRSGMSGADGAQDIAGLESLLVAYHVDIAIWGHHHTYQRSCASVVNGTCVTSKPTPTAHGPMHLVIGPSRFCRALDFSDRTHCIAHSIYDLGPHSC